MAIATYGNNIVINPSAAIDIANWTCLNAIRSSQAINGIATSFVISPSGSIRQNLTTPGTLCAIKVSFNSLLLATVDYYDATTKLIANLKCTAKVTNPDATVTTEYRNYSVPVVFHNGTFLAEAEFPFEAALISSAILTLTAGTTVIYVNGLSVLLKTNVASLSEQIDATKDYTDTAIETINTNMVTMSGDLYAKISDTNGNVATITQSVNSLVLRMASTEGNVSSLTQTATDFTFAFQTIGVEGYSRRGQTVINSQGISVYNGGFWLYDNYNRQCLAFDPNLGTYKFIGRLQISSDASTGYISTYSGGMVVASGSLLLNGVGRISLEAGMGGIDMNSIGAINIRTEKVMYIYSQYCQVQNDFRVAGKLTVSNTLYSSRVECQSLSIQGTTGADGYFTDENHRTWNFSHGLFLGSA